MRILITGASGLLGSKIAEISLQKGYEVYSGFNKHKALYGTPIHLDITNKKEVKKCFRTIKPEVVVHAAALTNVDRCEQEKDLAWMVNVEGTKNIVEESERHGAFLIYISTDYVFSGERGRYREEDKPSPINYYGLTKLEGEKLVKASELDWCIARPSVIYGSRPAAGKTNFVLWAINKLRMNEPIKIITDQWVSPTLNTNLAKMILEILERRLIGVYHLAGATPLSRYELTTIVAEVFHLDKALIHPIKSSEMKWLAKRPRDSSLNVEKALETLENKPLKIKEALKILKKELKI